MTAQKGTDQRKHWLGEALEGLGPPDNAGGGGAGGVPRGPPPLPRGGGVTGPIFGYSDTWQLVINTGTTIITFLLVFLIQRSQNKDSRAVHLKLNGMMAALQGASNRQLTVSHSVEETDERHRAKMPHPRPAKGRHNA